MGDRGGIWVVAQFVLMAGILLAVIVPPEWPSSARPWLTVLGAVLALKGAALAVWAGRTMGRALTPFPEPARGATLVETGPFAHVRHPVYVGALLLFVGWSLFAGPVALALTGLLALLWAGKAIAEERRLRARFPEYDGYARRVRWRLVPGVF